MLKTKLKKIAIIHHGCAKNLVDTELMAGVLQERGYEITLDSDDKDAEIVVINTCSFIYDAEKESVSSIFEMIGAGKKVIITGCLPQKHGEKLKALILEALGFVGTSDIDKIVGIIENATAGFAEKATSKAVKTAIKTGADKNFMVSKNPVCKYPENIDRVHITVGSSTYLKIAEGCDYACGYCVIPKLRGPYVSRPMENIIKEAKILTNKGVSEIILIAQDTSSYGIDLYKKPMLSKLLEELNKIENLSWIRVLYTYPTNFNDDLINAIATLDKVVKYVDIPLQHSHPDILKAMRRPVIDVLTFIKKLRQRIKGVCIRTTLITGYPTETEEHFEHLYSFVNAAKFDRLGVFEFSREKDTYAYDLKPQIPAKAKRARKNKILKLQKEISLKNNESLVGQKLPCIVEQVTDDGTAILRSYKDAPDVDGLVYVKTAEILVPGDIWDVKVTGFSDYDLFGEI